VHTISYNKTEKICTRQHGTAKSKSSNREGKRKTVTTRNEKGGGRKFCKERPTQGAAFRIWPAGRGEVVLDLRGYRKKYHCKKIGIKILDKKK